MRDGMILVIDDDDDFREVVADFLDAFGWTVHQANSLAAARAHFAHGPALAIVDWTLGDSTGADVVRELVAAVPSCKILVASGYGAAVTQEVASLIHGVLRKPFKLQDLMARMEEVLA